MFFKSFLKFQENEEKALKGQKWKLLIKERCDAWGLGGNVFITVTNLLDGIPISCNLFYS